MSALQPIARMARHAFLALVLPALAGCTGIVIPPNAPMDPVSVFLLDHGRHSSLVLPLYQPRGGVRYSYGDWDYYALGRTDIVTGLRALFLPTPGALGRQHLYGTLAVNNVATALRVEVEAVIEIRVEASASQRLQEALDELFARERHTAHYRADYDVHFVRHPEAYTLTHNSNRMVARWLEALGCEIEGHPVLSNWRLAN